MTMLPNYTCFEGRYWETASIRSALAYQGVKPPHTNAPISEALLMGISGGAAIGYFSFAYQGYDPHVALLTRSTFDPVDHLCERLGIVREVRQSTRPDKGVQNVLEALEEGKPAVVWADTFTLPYNALSSEDGMWVMMPVVVYGLDGETAHLADRSSVSLDLAAEVLAAARARTQDNRHKMMTVDLPDLSKLPRAVEKGIHACISLYTETPPKGAKHNFGLDALQRWIKLLTKDTDKQSWAKVFPAGRAMYYGLLTAFQSIETFGAGGAGRDHYADFLDEAALLLGRPGLHEAARAFRACVPVWNTLGSALLPDEITPFREARTLTLRQRDLFQQHGMAALDELKTNAARLSTLRASMATDFPLDAAGVVAHRQRIAAELQAVHAAENAALAALEQAME